MADTASILQEDSKKSGEALAAINPKLALISEKIKEFDVKPGKVYFLDKEGNNIDEGRCDDGKLKVPKGTKTIISNGPLRINGDIKNIDADKNINRIAVFAKGSVNVNGSAIDSQIIASGDVAIRENASGEITAGGNIAVKRTLLGDIAARGSVFANATNEYTKIVARRDVTILAGAHGQIWTEGNFSTKGAIYGKISLDAYGEVIAGGSITAVETRFGPQITARENILIKEIKSGEISAGKSILTDYIHPDAKIDTPQLFLKKGADKPKNFQGEIIEIPKAELEKLIPLPSKENVKALEDFRIIVGGTYTHASKVDLIHLKPTPSKTQDTQRQK